MKEIESLWKLDKKIIEEIVFENLKLKNLEISSNEKVKEWVENQVEVQIDAVVSAYESVEELVASHIFKYVSDTYNDLTMSE